MAITPADALRQHCHALERSLANHPDAEVRFVLALQTGARRPERRSTHPADGRWSWDSLFAAHQRNTRRRIEPYSIRDYPLTKLPLVEHMRGCVERGLTAPLPDPPVAATLWSAVFVTPNYEPVALAFIQQSERMAETAVRLLEAARPPLRPWVFNSAGFAPLLGVGEVEWFSLVCRLAKANQDTCTFGLALAYHTDIPTSEWTAGNHQAISRFISAWGAIEPDLPPGAYAIMPWTDARIASIEAIDILLQLEKGRPTDKPGEEAGNWFAATKALEWARKSGIKISLSTMGRHLDRFHWRPGPGRVKYEVEFASFQSWVWIWWGAQVAKKQAGKS
jgi:hypothetical protein